jgi:hypothetical protein
MRTHGSGIYLTTSARLVVSVMHGGEGKNALNARKKNWNGKKNDIPTPRSEQGKSNMHVNTGESGWKSENHAASA